MEQARLLEELRSLRNVACSWPDQDHWRLARLVEALNRGNSGEFSDENGSISSGCETASTANSEERTPGLEDSSNNSDCTEPEARSPRRVYFSDETQQLENDQEINGLRRNSDGSPNFITCTGSPKFFMCNGINNIKVFSMHEDRDNNNFTHASAPNSPMFDFEDSDDFGEEDVVDCSPRGEQPRRASEGSERRLKRADTFPPPIGKQNLIEDDEFSTLDALDEEADSDESGYVEAPPKTLLPDNSKDASDVERNSTGNFSQLSDTERGEIDPDTNTKRSSIHDELKSAMCPISETIKKLANASLKSSKSLEISTNNCLQKALSSLNTSKSFDSSISSGPDQDAVESPSLHQRKQLLAQQGVTV